MNVKHRQCYVTLVTQSQLFTLNKTIQYSTQYCILTYFFFIYDSNLLKGHCVCSGSILLTAQCGLLEENIDKYSNPLRKILNKWVLYLLSGCNKTVFLLRCSTRESTGPQSIWMCLCMFSWICSWTDLFCDRAVSKLHTHATSVNHRNSAAQTHALRLSSVHHCFFHTLGTAFC